MSEPIIWLLQEPPTPNIRDYSSLDGLGEIRNVLTPYEHPSKEPMACFMKMFDTLAEAEDGDYFLFAGGDPMTPFAAAFVIAKLGLEKVNWLKWDRNPDKSGGFYTPVEITMDQLDLIGRVAHNDG